MNTYADNTHKKKSQSAANTIVKKKNDNASSFHFEDNRPEVNLQRNLLDTINNSSNIKQLKAYQKTFDNYIQKKQLPFQKKNIENTPETIDTTPVVLKNSAGETGQNQNTINLKNLPISNALKVSASNVIQLNGVAKDADDTDPLWEIKKQYLNPSTKEKSINEKRDANEEESTKEILITKLKELSQDYNFRTNKKVTQMDKVEVKEWSNWIENELPKKEFRELELLHAWATYEAADDGLAKKKVIKNIKKPLNHRTPIDELRSSKIKDPTKEHSEYLDKQNAKREDLFLDELLPKMIELSDNIRLTHYYDSQSEKPILESGRLQSKKRREIKAKKDEKITSKSSGLDDDLGNTDHVFFFAEYQDEKTGTSPFRQTRFGGKPNKAGEEEMNVRTSLEGDERRVSFPLNKIPSEGVHGYIGDLISLSGGLGVNVAEDVFSSASPYQEQEDRIKKIINTKALLEKEKTSKKKDVTTKDDIVDSVSLSEGEEKKATKDSTDKSISLSEGKEKKVIEDSTGKSISLSEGKEKKRTEETSLSLKESRESSISESHPAPGVHLLMDLLRQRFKTKNFPPKVTKKKSGIEADKAMVANLKEISLENLYNFLFKEHPNIGKNSKNKPVNPQILVPGSVPFQTPGVRFESPDIKKTTTTTTSSTTTLDE